MENENSTKNFKICSSFVLKLIALLSMTFDHIGVMSYSYGYNLLVFDIFRIIGRIAMPLFCFMIVEGVLHTKSFPKYILRLSIMAVVISIALIVLVSVPSLGFQSMREQGNIFLDLALGATTIYCLRLKGSKKLFALLPFAYVITSFVASKIEVSNQILIHWFPYFLRTQYGLLSFSLIVLFYLSYLLKDFYFKGYTKGMGVPEDTFVGSDYERNIVNIISSLFLLTTALLFHFLNTYLTYQYLDVQLYSIFAGAFILLYNGKRGYNSKWFEYGSYLYYPVHILLIALVFYLLHL